MLLEKFLNEEPKFIIEDNVIVGCSSNEKETRNVAQVMLDSLNGHPDFVAQIDAQTGKKTTFFEIKDHSTRCALWLRKQSVCEEDVIGVMTYNQQDDFIPYLSTVFINAIYSPWFHKISEINARRYFEVCRPKVMFASEQSIDILAKAANEAKVDCKFVVYGKHPTFPSLKSLMAQQTEEEVKNFKYEVPKVSGKKVGMVFFSSGTTGNPKATILPYDCLLQYVPDSTTSIENVDYWLWYSSLAWITGTIYVALMIIWRFTRIFHVEYEPRETSKVIEKYKVNFVAHTPTMLTQSYKAGVLNDYDYSSVKLMIVTGSTISKTVLEECRQMLPHTFIGNYFGMTEAGQFVARQNKFCKKTDSIGFICKGISIKVIDRNTGNAQGPNQQGEICFKIDTAMLGYMRDEQATKDVIDTEGWIHSGDLGYYDANGEISLVDRIKNIINYQTNKISPSAIENILLEHPAVAKCAVVPVPHSIDIERPFAFVVKAPNAQVTAEELIELPAVHNAFYKLSGGLVFVDDLVYTTSGKINTKQMKDKAMAYAC